MSSKLKTISYFLVKFLAFYCLLLALWPYCRSSYISTARICGASLIEQMVLPDCLQTKTVSTTRTPAEALFTVYVITPASALQIRLDGWSTGFQPLILMVSLVLSTPLEQRRRVWALLASLFLIHAFTLARLSLFAAFTLIEPSRKEWYQGLRWIVFDLSQGLSMTCIGPFVIWVSLLGLNRVDFHSPTRQA